MRSRWNKSTQKGRVDQTNNTNSLPLMSSIQIILTSPIYDTITKHEIPTTMGNWHRQFNAKQAPHASWYCVICTTSTLFLLTTCRGRWAGQNDMCSNCAELPATWHEHILTISLPEGAWHFKGSLLWKPKINWFEPVASTGSLQDWHDCSPNLCRGTTGSRYRNQKSSASRWKLHG